MDTEGNRRVLTKSLAGKDFIYTAGTHEFQIGPIDALAQPGTYYEECKARIEREAGVSFASASRVIGGVNLITLDNSQDFFPLAAREMLLKEIERGLPIILFTHVPINCQTLKVPRPAHYRFTEEEFRIHLETLELITSCPLIKANFAGHWHSRDDFPDRTPPVYVTPGTYAGIVRLIEFR